MSSVLQFRSALADRRNGPRLLARAPRCHGGRRRGAALAVRDGRPGLAGICDGDLGSRRAGEEVENSSMAASSAPSEAAHVPPPHF